jgi:hypothetical protein
MKNDPKSCYPAEVDVSKARFTKSKDLSVEFFNEIDVWTQIEFKARYQIKQLKSKGFVDKVEVHNETNTIYYCARATPE